MGLILGALLCALITKTGATLMLQVPSLTISPFTAFVCLGIALLIGFVSSFVPAWNAARTNILDSLRYEG
jgi:putative ABC transport system permease protein